MAFLAGGSTPGRGVYGSNIDQLIDFLVDNTSPEGLIAASDGVTSRADVRPGLRRLFLCECYGMAEQESFRDRLAAAIELIVVARMREGGWRYAPSRGTPTFPSP